MTIFQIWHDNDFDLASWFYENLAFPPASSIEFRQIPKTNSASDLLRHLQNDMDLALLPAIRLETPDLVLIRIKDESAKILLVAEFMTHTPQHDHPLQRYGRLYNAALLGIPSFLILPGEKEKLEKKKGEYKPVLYRPNPLAFHLFIETSRKTGTDALLILWPTQKGYLQYDRDHPTAPKKKDEIEDFFSYTQAILDKVSVVSLSDRILDRMIAASAYSGNTAISSYSLSTVSEEETTVALAGLSKPRSFSSTIDDRFTSVVYSPEGLRSGKNLFRTDPYGGKLCAFDMLFCRDASGIRAKNLILRANKVLKVEDGSEALLAETHDFAHCPFVRQTTLAEAKRHWSNFCPYVERKQQRIYGTVPDLVIFDGGETFEP